MRNVIIITFLAFYSLSLLQVAKGNEIFIDASVVPQKAEQTQLGVNVLVGGVIDGKKPMIAKISGPYKTISIRKKSKALGIWSTSKPILIKDIATYYQAFNQEIIVESIANSAFLETNNLLPNYYFMSIQEQGDLYAQLLKYLQAKNLYHGQYGRIEYIGKNFFQIHIHLPPNALIGKYRIDIYTFDSQMLSDGNAILYFDLKNKDDFLSKLRNSLKSPLVNALACISIAILFGLISGLRLYAARQ